jgi:hypothetical protein
MNYSESTIHKYALLAAVGHDCRVRNAISPCKTPTTRLRNWKPNDRCYAGLEPLHIEHYISNIFTMSSLFEERLISAIMTYSVCHRSTAQKPGQLFQSAPGSILFPRRMQKIKSCNQIAEGRTDFIWYFASFTFVKIPQQEPNVILWSTNGEAVM